MPSSGRITAFAAGVLLLAAELGLAQPLESHSGKPLARVVLVGDSTMAPRTGYGNALCQRMAPVVECINSAKGGRSTGSYRTEGSWAEVLVKLGAQNSVPTWVFIQFGHNDQPGKPGRSTDLQTEYPLNLERYVQDVRERGATPVLVTPLTRRTFKGTELENNLLPWADSMRAVAVRLGVALIELNKISWQRVQTMGQAEADTLAMEPPPAVAQPALTAGATETVGEVKSTFDRTHVGDKGAQLFADMVAQEARKLTGLQNYFNP